MAKKKKRKAKQKRFVTVPLTMAINLKEVMGEIAHDAGTDIPTACQVLIVTAMRMGRNAANAGNEAALKEAAVTIQKQDAMLHRCRKVMEANDPGNALDIFGPPAPEGAPTVP